MLFALASGRLRIELSPFLTSIAIIAFAQPAFSSSPDVLECPGVMAHTPAKDQYPEWTVYSNKPLRLTGADIAYVVDGHLEATLEPDLIRRLSDPNQSTTSIFNLTKHRRQGPFSLVCHYGVHAQLGRDIPANIAECVVDHRAAFNDDVEGEFQASCQ